jgi:hypothetical protein
VDGEVKAIVCVRLERQQNKQTNKTLRAKLGKAQDS